MRISIENEQLYLRQKALLDTFLKNGAINISQYNKSLSDLILKMNVYEPGSDSELDAILMHHSSVHEKMTPTDAVKLIYQNEFGGGHLISDPTSSLNWIKEEYLNSKGHFQGDIIEDIGNGTVRLSLAVIDKGVSPDLINGWFVSSAAERQGDMDSFLHKIEVLKAATKSGYFGFTPDELNSFLKEYKKTGYVPVSHSEEYRNEYNPSYRVVLKRYLPETLMVNKEAVYNKDAY